MPAASWSSRLAAVDLGDGAGDAVARLERVGDGRAQRQGAKGQSGAEDGEHQRIFGRGRAGIVLAQMPMPDHRTIPMPVRD